MKKLFYKFRIMSIKMQLLYFAVIYVIIIAGLCLFVNFAMQKILVNTNTEYVDTLNEKFKMEILSVYQQMDNVCTQIQYNVSCTDLLKAKSYNQISASLISSINAQKASIIWLNNAINDIAFSNDLINWSSIYSVDDLRIMNKKVQMGYGTECLGIHYSSSKPYQSNPYLVFAHPLYNNYKPIGTVYVSVDLQKSSIKLPYTEDTNAYFLLYDKNKQITPFNCSASVAKNIFNSLNNNIPTGSFSGKESLAITTDSYLIQTVYLPSISSYIISAIDISNAYEKLSNVIGLNWCIVIGSVTIIALMALILYLNFIIPLNKFSDTIAYIKGKKLRKLDKPLKLTGCMEVQNISIEFTDLLLSINDLNVKIVNTSNNLYEAELQRRIAEISFLRSQINPHFLYNTLELIRSVAQEHNTAMVEEITVAMGKILRYSIKGDDEVTLEQELEITTAYLKIQQARFNNKITVLTNITEDAKKLSVVKMLLQPIVENSVFYGLEPKGGEGIIFINGHVDNNNLIITVRDNGIGIKESELQLLKDSLTSKTYATSKHIGLVNTNARIKLSYGEQYGIEIESRINDGTCVAIKLPVINFIQKETN